MARKTQETDDLAKTTRKNLQEVCCRMSKRLLQLSENNTENIALDLEETEALAKYASTLTLLMHNSGQEPDSKKKSSREPIQLA